MILDSMMEEGRGELMREDPPVGGTTPVYLLSRWGHAGDDDDAAELSGFTGVFQKPVDVERLLTVVRLKRSRGGGRRVDLQAEVEPEGAVCPGAESTPHFVLAWAGDALDEASPSPVPFWRLVWVGASDADELGRGGGVSAGRRRRCRRLHADAIGVRGDAGGDGAASGVY
ncbi:MAG: hypothetical protein R3B49_05465 [Phycisphaerales bacterium]